MSYDINTPLFANKTSRDFFSVDVGPNDYAQSVANVHVNTILGMSRADAKALAQRFAASGEILEALKESLEIGGDIHGWAERARAAIAKAEGRS